MRDSPWKGNVECVNCALIFAEFMANFKTCPVKVPHTYSSHFGPGSQWGKPYYPLGQECEKPIGAQQVQPPGTPLTRYSAPDSTSVPAPCIRDHPLDLSYTRHRRSCPNQRHREKTLRVFGDPPSSRSCVVTHNKDGLVMDSLSHYQKIGSKHFIDPRPDHSLTLHKSLSSPHINPWNHRRAQFCDPTPWHFNAAFSTASDEIGKFYSAPLMKERDSRSLPRMKYDWYGTKEHLSR